MYCSDKIHSAQTYSVVSGPGRIVGVHSGDPASHEPNQAEFHTAYHGLVRAVVQVTTHLAASRADRMRMKRMEPDNEVVMVDTPEREAAFAAQDIVVEASAPGLPAQRVAIKTSTDAAQDGVLAVAAKTAGTSVLGGFE